jgi:MFS family permease
LPATLTQQLGLPKMRGHEALVIAFLIDALGTGLFLPFSLLYFQTIAGLALPAIGATLTVATLAGLIITPTVTALAAASSPSYLQGRYMALYQFSWGIASAMAPSMFTLLYTLGPPWPWVALTGLSLAAGLIIILLESHLSVHAVHVRQ